MNIKLLFGFIAVLILIADVSGSGDAQEKPHIIVIHFDDLGHWDIGYNNPEVITPNLDQLARQGVILLNNYHQQTCTPSRAAFLSGVYSHKSQMQGGVISNTNPHCLPTNIPILPQHLKQAGYQTHMVGKWNIGYCQWNCTPTFRGFDTFTGMYSGSEDYYTHDANGGYDWRHNIYTDLSVNGTYNTDLVRDAAMDKIADYAEGDDPLFMWLAFTCPHDPYQIDYQQFLDLYPNVEEPRKTILAMISYGDMIVGELVRLLIQKGLWDNTFLFFSSDNGGHSILQGGSNHPYRSGKGSMFEGGTKVVGFATGPLLNKTDYTHDGLFHVVDLVPSLMSIAGLDPDNVTHLDGFDQSDMLLHGGPSKRHEIIYNIDLQESGNNFLGDVAIREADMKLIWGIPGQYDGYGHNQTEFYHSDYWLAFIGKTQADYHDPPGDFEQLSAEELTFGHDIEKSQGVVNMTRDTMNRGHVLLFNLTADPYEEHDLHADPEYHPWVMYLKNRIMDIVDEGYAPVDPDLMYARVDASDPENYPFDAWTPGWCNSVNMTVDLFDNSVD